MNDWVSQVLERLGTMGVALLMFLENVVPPIPSELIMPLSGYHARLGQASLVAAILAGSVGSLLGTLGWYWIGLRLGGARLDRFVARHGRWLAITPEELARSRKWLERRGRWAILFGRLVPGVRTLISLPAGAAEMPLGPFLLFSTIGTLAWTAALGTAGYVLAEQHDRVERVLGPVSYVVIGGMLLVYLVRVLRPQRPATA